MAVERFVRACVPAVVAAATLAVAPSAHAILINGSWDPFYDLPFTGPAVGTSDDMRWAGKGQFFVPDACVPTGPGTVAITCAGMELRNTTIDLFVGNATTAFANISFGSQAAAISAARFVNGQLTGVVSGYFDPWAAATGNTALFDVAKFDFTLAFEFVGPTLYHANIVDTVSKHTHGHDDTEHFWNGVGNGHLGDTPCANDPRTFTVSTALCGFSATPATVTFAPIALAVPETPVAWLGLAGLLGLGFARRRARPSAIA